MTLRSCLLLLAIVAVQGAFAGAASNPQVLQAYVTAGRSVSDQIAYMKKTSPQQFGIVVVEALEPPNPAFVEGGVSYYYQDARGVDWMFVRWFLPDPQAPADRFKLHYGVRPRRNEKPLEQKGRGIAFIVPARAQGIFVAELILAATSESILDLRRALIAALP